MKRPSKASSTTTINVENRAVLNRPSGASRDRGGLAALSVVGLLAVTLGVVSAVWPAAEITPSEDRQPTVEETHSVGDLPYTAIKNGLGPAERDRANGGFEADDGDLITIAGQTYERGLGVHTPSRIRLYPDQTCTKFVADIGIDSGSLGTGDVVFEIFVDEISVYQSEPMTWQDEPRRVELDINQVERLDLVVTATGEDGIAADWAGAALVCEA